MNFDIVDFFEWAWTGLNLLSVVMLVFIVRDALLDWEVAKTVLPIQNGRRGIYAAMTLRIRLFLLTMNGLFFLSGVGAMLTPNPVGAVASSRIITSSIIIALTVMGDIVILLDLLDRRKIRSYESRKPEKEKLLP